MEALSTISFQTSEQIQQPGPVVEDGVKGADAEEVVKRLTQRIVDLSSRLVAKDELANQQARVAREAIEDLISKDEQMRQYVVALKEEKAAREKADARYISIKQELDKASQHKGSVEARMVQLHGALKECMGEMRHAKDELEHNSQDATSRKREWDKLRGELESENVHLKRQLMEARAENMAVCKSLQERARSLAEISESKSKVESDSKILQVQIESLHKDMDAYKYEIHLLKKELQISNDQREQNKKVADAAHKQHLENVKKIAKLDSECNRLRALVRKRLPGPAAIALMRVEADHVGKKRLPSPKISLTSSPEQKEMEALTDRLISMEDETKLLKEALVKRTAELQTARQLCVRTASKLSSTEGILEAVAKGQALPTLSIEEHRSFVCSVKADSAQQEAFECPPSAGCESVEVMDWTLSSEDGMNNDDELSSAESWASALIAELSHIKKDDGIEATKIDKNIKPRIINDSDLQIALQELSSKLSSIGANILALPSSMRNVGEQGNVKSLHLEVLSQIMEEFTLVKQLLVEVGKSMELERNQMQVDRRVQESESNKTDGSVVIDYCDEEAKLHVESDTVKETYVGVVRKVMETLLALVESKQGDMEAETDDGKGILDHLRVAMNVLDGGRVVQNLSKDAAAEVLCKMGDVLKLQNGVAQPGNTSNMEGENVVSSVAAGVEDGDNSAGEIISGNNSAGEIISGNNLVEQGYNSVNNDNSVGEIMSGNNSVKYGDNSINEIAFSAFSSFSDDEEIVHGDEKLIGVVVPSNISVGVSGSNRVSGVINCGNDARSVEEANGKLLTKNCELTLQLEILQHEVGRLSSERDEIEGKLMAVEAELELQRARVGTLEAESVQLVQDKASLVKELSDVSSSKQNLEEDLTDARANLDDLRLQVSTLTSELADQAARCEELQGNLMSLPGVGTPARERIGGDADGKARKEHEIASAKEQLAECQRTILVLGNQLRALSSAQDHVASFDSSLESATSTDPRNLPPAGEGDGDVPLGSVGAFQVAGRNARQRRLQPAYVRTRGGRLVSADHVWGSSGDIPVPGNDNQGTPSHPAACYSFGSRHVPMPRHFYGVACPQSPLHEYVTEPAASAYMYSPPETALSSPAGSPARFNLQLERSRRAPPVNGPTGAANLLKTMHKAAAATGAAGCPTPSPAKKATSTSRIARFFSRAKTQG